MVIKKNTLIYDIRNQVNGKFGESSDLKGQADALWVMAVFCF